MNIALIFIVIAGGVGLTLQAAMNARLREIIGQPIIATIVSFLVGLVVLFAVGASGILGRFRGSDWHSVPWWAWIGGVFGAIYVTTATIAVPRIGTGVLTSAAVTGQLLAALVLDSLGLMGVPRLPITAWRLGGALLLIAGVILMQRK